MDERETETWDSDADPPTAIPTANRPARYEVREEIGRGGMGIVHAAFDHQLGRRIALKLVHPDGVTPARRARLLGEARALAKLTHPNIVVVYDAGELDGQVFVAMELVDGASLRGWLETAPRPWRRTVELFVAAGRGLAAAHAAGVIHRDIKPDNILVDRDGVPRVADFGLARIPGDAAEAPGTVAGTRAYLAPEVLAGAPADALADQYALAVSLAEALGIDAAVSPGSGRGGVPGGDRADRGGAREIAEARADGGGGDRADRGGAREIAEARADRGGGDRADRGGAREVAETRADRGGVPGGDRADRGGAREIATERDRRSGRDGGRVPGWVRAVVERGRSQDPAARFPSVEAFVAALARDPWRRRRRITIGAAAVAVAGGIAVAVALAWPDAAPTAAEACAGAARPLDGVWDGARRKGVVENLAALAPYAGPTATDVAGALDRYAADLGGGERAACEATARGSETSQLAGLRAACLARRRSQLASVVNELSHVALAGLSRAPAAVAELEPIAGCGDAADLLRAPLVPADPVAATTAAALHDDIERMRIRIRLADFTAALADLPALVARATALGHRPTLAEAEYAQGLAEQFTGAMEPAEVHMRAALADAQASQHDLIVGHIAASIAMLLARTPERAGEAEPWIQLALATSERLGRPPHLESYVHVAYGLIASHRREYDIAERNLQYAIDLVAGTTPDDIRLAEQYNSLGGVALGRTRYADAEALYRRARAIIVAHRGEGDPALVAIDDNLGSVAFALGDVTHALALRRATLAAREKTAPPAQLGREHLNLAFALAATGDTTDAVMHAHTGAELEAAINPPRALLAQIWLAELMRADGKVDEATAIARSAVEATEAAGPDARTFEAAALAQVAEGALERGAPVEAVGTLLVALVLVSPDLGEATLHPEIATVLVPLARALRLAGLPFAGLAQHARDVAVAQGPGTARAGRAALEVGLALGDRTALTDAIRILGALPGSRATLAEARAALARLK